MAFMNVNKSENGSAMDSLIKRLHMAETELRSKKEKLSMYKEKLKHKDKIIADLKKKLEDKAESMQEVTSVSRSTEHSEKHCQKLQQQLAEMEKFLADYGLKWVGEVESKDNRSVANYEPHGINFDVVMENIARLNKLAGEDTLQIAHTSQGAAFKSPERVLLKFYANGFLFSSGPFSEYSEPRAQLFIGDLMDGFFPSELQLIYPNGVIIEVNDRRDYLYENDKEVLKPFTGRGFRLGSGK